MTHEHEAKPLYLLSDRQVIEALRGRGNDLHALKAMDFLCRMFQKAAESNPTCEPGLAVAIGLTKLYSQSYAPGHEEHPFKDADKNATVASILRSAPTVATLPPMVVPVGRKPRVANVERGIRPQSKMGVVSDIVLKLTGSVFSAVDVQKLCPEGYTYQDVQNAFTWLKSKRKLLAVAQHRGQYVLTDAPPILHET